MKKLSINNNYNLIYTVSEEEFLDFFSQFGQVIDSVVMVDRETLRSRGFGFVTYANEVSSNKIMIE